ncbi:MAG: hypothetical protein KatS3mg031_2212 [Chitinophagales bacterium]|nr:MAG: hypothetical protein KatS3mg031_2212 [Chitinophagales bacterium]
MGFYKFELLIRLMKRLIPILILSMAVSLHAQVVLTHSVDTAGVIGLANEAEIVLPGFVYNNSNDTVRMRWERIENIPAGWLTAICDNIQCWAEVVSRSPLPVIIPPRGQSTMDVHFFPNSIAGTGSVTIRAWVEGDSAATVVVSAPKQATANQPVGFDASTDNDRIRVYPNPVRDYFIIRNLPAGKVSTVEVFNIFGKKMLSFSQPALRSNAVVHRFDISSLSKGIYLVRVFDENMNVIFTKSLSKE